MTIKVQSTGDNDSVEDAMIAIMSIKTKDGKLLTFKEQLEAVFESIREQIELHIMVFGGDPTDFYGESLVKGLKNE